MSYNFDFSYIRNGAPVVTLSSHGIAFNKGAIDLLDSPAEINIGYDVEKRTIGVQARNKELDVPYFEFASRKKNDWVRIGAKDFIKHLAKVSKIDFITKAKQFIPEFDEETRTLLVIIDNEHLK